MLVFDAPERNQCLVHRQSTSTPLQGLYLLNDVQITEAARFISERMLREGGADTGHQVRWAFRLVTSRAPTDAEAEILLKLYREQRDLFANDLAATERLLTVGEASNSPALSPVELAAGAVLAEALLNHDEALMRR
jgi:hypothetical protein